MVSRSRILLAALTAVVWVIPSIGTQGMGTLGQRVVHPDARLLDADGMSRDASRGALAKADAVVEGALGF